MERYSANAPVLLTPTPLVLGHRWRRPARQFLQCPQTMWPSPETSSPTLKSETPAPTAAISPQYSWPMVMGTGMVFCAHLSHL